MNAAQKVLDAAQEASEAYNKLEYRLEQANAEILKIRKMAYQAALADRHKATNDDHDLIMHCLNIMER